MLSETLEQKYSKYLSIEKQLKMAMLKQAVSCGGVAEGVETGSTLAKLRDLGCWQGLGFFYSRPVSDEEFADCYTSYIRTTLVWPACAASRPAPRPPDIAPRHNSQDNPIPFYSLPPAPGGLSSDQQEE